MESVNDHPWALVAEQVEHLFSTMQSFPGRKWPPWVR